MRLLYILPAEGFGGAERQGVVHIAQLPKAGIEVVAAVGPGQPIRTQLAQAGVTDYAFCSEFPDLRVEAPGWRAGFRRPFAYLHSWSRSVRRLIRLGREQKVDLVFAGRTFGWTVGSVVARRLHVPVVWRAGSHPVGRTHRLALCHLAPLIAPDLVLANSESGRRTYAEALSVPTQVLRNAVDTFRFGPAHAEPRIRRELGLLASPVIGLAARPSPEKGLDCLAATARIIVTEYPAVRFLVAGEFPWRAHYEERFREAGLGQHVSFLGHLDDIESFYASCDVVLLTSGRGSIEMSSNAILEAMSMGRAVVVTNVGGMAEIVEDRRNGFVVPPDDPAALACRTSLLLGNPELRRVLGLAARRRAVSQHAQEIVSKQLAELLLALCRRRSASAARGRAHYRHKETA